MVSGRGFFELNTDIGMFSKLELGEIVLLLLFIYVATVFFKLDVAREKAVYGEQSSNLEEKLKRNKKENFQLFQRAYHDFLTGLYNRTMMEEQINISIELAKEEWKTISFLFLDIDNFKAVNDTWGHDAGDQCLVEVASRLRHVFTEFQLVEKKGSFIARIAGDEFIIVFLDSAGEILVDDICSRLLSMSEVKPESFNIKKEEEGEGTKVTLSVGAYMIDFSEKSTRKELQDVSSSELRAFCLTMADKNMYRAKEVKNSFDSSLFKKQDLIDFKNSI